MTAGKTRKEWMYRSTAEKQYRLSKHQLEQAAGDGLVETRGVRNPHYRSGPLATLVKIADVEANLDRIKRYSKYSVEERNRRETYRQRAKLRDELEFYCPRCKQKIRARKDSKMFEECFRGGAGIEAATRALKVAHYRHQHTPYPKALGERRNKRYDRYQELRGEGMDFEEAWATVDDEFGEPDFRGEFNKEAIELLKKDGLLEK